jgi:ABC-type transport system involved in multi-copper enzyme maturation permease subunit
MAARSRALCASMQVFFALIADTFQEARARWLFWGLFSLSTLLILLFLFVLQVDVAAGAISALGVQSTVRRIYSIQRFVDLSYSWVCVGLYVFGTFLAILASAGLIPSVLEPGRISLLLSKPIGRTTLLLGRYFGNLLIVVLNTIYIVSGVWLIFAVKTNIRDYRFLLAIPIMIFVFAVLLCVVVFVGVISESAALSVMVPVAISLISGLLAQHQFMIKVLSSEWSRRVWLGLYWIVPKDFDLGKALHYWILLDRETDWVTPIWTSAAFGLVVLISSIVIFRKRDF